MGDIARCSLGGDRDYHNEELLYKMFGVNAELLIDHAWGWEPVTMDLVRAYRPETNCISSGQVLQCPYDFERARLVVREMADALALELVEKRMVTDQVTLTVGYDRDNLTNPGDRGRYRGEVTVDRYGRRIPKHAHGTANLKVRTSSGRKIVEAVMKLYEEIVDPVLTVRRVILGANRLVDEKEVGGEDTYVQMDLFTDYGAMEREKEAEDTKLAKERKLQEAVLAVKKKYGRNAVLKGTSLQEGATARERNHQIGGHKA